MRSAAAIGLPETPEQFRRMGVNVNQEDLPYWCMPVLGWLRMVQSILEAFGDVGIGYQRMLRDALEQGAAFPYVNEKTGRSVMLRGPHAVYSIFQSYSEQMKAQAGKAG